MPPRNRRHFCEKLGLIALTREMQNAECRMQNCGISFGNDWEIGIYRSLSGAAALGSLVLRELAKIGSSQPIFD